EEYFSRTRILCVRVFVFGGLSSERTMTRTKSPFSVQDRVRGPWRVYIDSLEPMRPELHRYCSRLAGNVWDGEDLLQDTLVRVFALMGKIDADLTNPRAYFVRTATNLWIDRLRKRKLDRAWADGQMALNTEGANTVDPLEVRDAARSFLIHLT